MKGIKSVCFVFENVESFSIDAKYFGVLTIGDFERRIERIASNYISDSTIAHKILFEIFPEGDGEYDSYGKQERKFWRIREWDDITHIELTYDDDTVEYICVDYDEGLFAGNIGAPNVNQTSMISELGNLYICIWAGHRVRGEFPSHEISSSEENEMKKDFYFRIDDEIASMTDEEKKAKISELENSMGPEEDGEQHG